MRVISEVVIVVAAAAADICYYIAVNSFFVRVLVVSFSRVNIYTMYNILYGVKYLHFLHILYGEFPSSDHPSGQDVVVGIYIKVPTAHPEQKDIPYVSPS
jgi:hypothetical protein